MIENSTVSLNKSIVPTILVYDEALNKLELITTLQEAFDIELITADDVESLVELAYDKNVDIIILNIEGEMSNGLRIIEYCHEVPELKDIAILAAFECDEGEESIRKHYSSVDILKKPLHKGEITNRLAIYLKLINKSYELEKSNKMVQVQLQHTQEILNTQEDMLAVFSEENIILANSSFLDFFHVDSLEKFLIEYDCLAKTFISEENSFIDASHHNASIWINQIKDLNPDDRQVVIVNPDNVRHRFKIQLQSYEQDQVYTVITLFDMTDIYDRSKKYEQYAFYDQLTGVANRRKFEDHLNVEISRADRFETPLSIMMFDLDHFKSINDTYGHDKGDEILRNFAQKINQRIRKEELFARWGGEEFILLIVGCTELENIFTLANDLLKRTQSIEIVPDKPLTCSIGITNYKKGMEKHQLIKKVDEALYIAKASGRNRYELI